MSSSCSFCEVIENKECKIVFEDNLVVAFLDIDPINEGHILIVPKEHYIDIDEIPVDVLYTIIKVAKCIVKKLKEIYNLDGYCIMQNGGYFNDIGHFHLHVFPRYINDGFNFNYPENNAEFSDDICNKLFVNLED